MTNKKKLAVVKPSIPVEVDAAKPRRGRPPSPDRVQTWFRSTPAEQKRWKAEARRLGMPLRVWIRAQLNHAVSAPPHKERTTDG